MTNSKPSIMIV